MTQPSADILLRIERLLSLGKQQEARSLLVEYVKQNPDSARAWWLMSLTLTDIPRQMDCLQRVLRLDPKNEPARERLAILMRQPKGLPTVNPFTAVGLAAMEKPAVVETANRPAPEPVSRQPAAEQAPPPVPPAPAEPDGKTPPPRKSKPKWGLVLLLVAVFAIGGLVLLNGYLTQQREAQAQALSLQKTLAIAQTLTSLPLPTRIPTWTASPTWTTLPTATITFTPSPTPSPLYTVTRTPRPTSLVGAVVGLYAPDFSLTEFSTGRKVTLSQFEGQPVMLFFWATWCVPCKSEMDSIKTISQDYKADGLEILAINTAEDPGMIFIFQDTYQLAFPILLDPDIAIQTAYHVVNLPRHFFINSTGMIVSVVQGEMTYSELKAQVEAIKWRFPTSSPTP